MVLSEEEQTVLRLLNDTPADDAMAHPALQGIDMSVAETVQMLLAHGYIEEIELPPNSGKLWYVHTEKAQDELLGRDTEYVEKDTEDL